VARLRERIRRRADSLRVIVVFLGDNVYPAGLRRRGHGGRADSVRLEAQLSVARGTDAEVVFLAGNHDWGPDEPDALRRLRRQDDFLRRRGGGESRLIPVAGCPGPAVRDRGSALRLVFLDTEWFVGGRRPRTPEGCASRTEGEVVAGIREALRGAGGRRTVVLGHHPLRSGGRHGGYVPLRAHVFPLTPLVSWLWLPLPGARALFELYRKVDPQEQGMDAPRYRAMIDSVRSGLRGRPPFLYAAGHEHVLQVIRASASSYHVVSGAASEGMPVGDVEGSLHRSSSRGYVRLDVTAEGAARISVHVLEVGGDGGGFREAWARRIPRDTGASGAGRRSERGG